MSNLLPPILEECSGAAADIAAIEPLAQHQAQVGSLTVRRVLPVRGRRLIGPWCFFDRYGPLTFADGKPMDVAPHPHIGLQTFTWLMDGEVVHNDSLGSECLIRPGELSLMTAGRGIAHTEETPANNSGKLNGTQLWIALPGKVRAMAPEYQCIKDLTTVERSGGLVTVVAGEFEGYHSPAHLFSSIIGLDITVHRSGAIQVPLDVRFEHGLMLLSGDASVEDVSLQQDVLYYAGMHRSEIEIASKEGARLMAIGGAPFGETILMWWNFVARTSEEIAAARQSWINHEVFADVPRYKGDRLPAPVLAGRPIPSNKRV